MSNESKYPVSIIKAIHQVKSKVSYIKKDGKNEFHGYKYASEAAFLKALNPELQEAGLIILQSGNSISPIDANGVTTVTLEYTLCHIDGDVWPDKLVAYGQGSDRSSKGTVGDKGVYKAITGGGKYFLRNLFQIETGTDPEKETGTEKEKTEQTKTEPVVPRDQWKQKPPEGDPGVKLISEPQRKRLFAISKENGWSDAGLKELLFGHGYESSSQIAAGVHYKNIIAELECTFQEPEEPAGADVGDVPF